MMRLLPLAELPEVGRLLPAIPAEWYYAQLLQLAEGEGEGDTVLKEWGAQQAKEEGGVQQAKEEEWLSAVCAACDKLAAADLRRYSAEVEALAKLAAGAGDHADGAHLATARSAFQCFEMVCAPLVQAQVQRRRELDEAEGTVAKGNQKVAVKRELAKRWKGIKKLQRPGWGVVLHGWCEGLAAAEKRRAEGATEIELLA
jgi:hypothetical protein